MFSPNLFNLKSLTIMTHPQEFNDPNIDQN